MNALFSVLLKLLFVGALLATGSNVLGQENTLATCSDGLDNDGDGLIDCEDGDCEGICVEALIDACITIDFETVAGETPINATPIGNQFLAQGVSFILSNGDLPVLADYGGIGQGFSSSAGQDQAQPEFQADLGSFFLTDDGNSGGLESMTVICELQVPSYSVQGQILDVDNGETFTAIAYDAFDNVVGMATVESGGNGAGDGIPTWWEILAPDACIWKVELMGESPGNISYGFGIDNLVICYGSEEELCLCAENAPANNWLGSLCTGCTDPTACNYNPSAINEDGSCIYPDGCTDSTACNYDENALCDDGSCLFGEGCTDPDSCNYDPAAECDAGCIYPDGCTDAAACNFDPQALCDDGSCLYNFGCTDNTACNYDPSAECDDGSCDFSCLGCTDPMACNFDPTATIENASCTYPGCTNGTACNFDPFAGCDDGSCILPDGCTDPTACNYDSTAVCNNGSCDFISCADCAGTPYGLAILDTCGFCLLLEDELFNWSCVGDAYIPTGFTPNGDGVNDVFGVVSARIFLEFELYIFDRWGETVFYSQDPAEVWTGEHKNGAFFVPDGHYAYQLNYRYEAGDPLRQTGVVAIVR